MLLDHDQLAMAGVELVFGQQLSPAVENDQVGAVRHQQPDHFAGVDGGDGIVVALVGHQAVRAHFSG